MLNKMKFKTLFLILIVFCLFLFSGCSQEDCSLKDTDYKKYSFDDSVGECVLSESIEKNKPDNGVIEKGENYCNAPKDVPKAHPTLGCTGKIGDYIEKQCNEKTKACEYAQNEKVISQKKVIDFKNSDLIIQADINLNTPFVLNTSDKNKVSVVLSLFKTIESPTILVKDIVIKSFSIKNSAGTVYAEYDFNKPLKNIGDKLNKIELSLAQTNTYEKKEKLDLVLVVSYSKDYFDKDGVLTKNEPKSAETLRNSLGTWTIINPKFDPK